MITVYTKPNCSFCWKAKELLADNQIPFVIIDISQDVDAKAFLKAEGHKMVPQIYHDRVLIEGGYEGLAALSEDELKAFRV